MIFKALAEGAQRLHTAHYRLTIDKPQYRCAWLYQLAGVDWPMFASVQVRERATHCIENGTTRGHKASSNASTLKSDQSVSFMKLKGLTATELRRLWQISPLVRVQTLHSLEDPFIGRPTPFIGQKESVGNPMVALFAFGRIGDA